MTPPAVMKWQGHPNLRARPAKPSLNRGPVPRAPCAAGARRGEHKRSCRVDAPEADPAQNSAHARRVGSHCRDRWSSSEPRKALALAAAQRRKHGNAMTKAVTKVPEIAAALSLLAERWPKCFSVFERRRRPLKVGIDRDIKAALDGGRLYKGLKNESCSKRVRQARPRPGARQGAPMPRR